MAYWMTHLRVAEKIAQTIPELNTEWFYFGNIAADSGRYIIPSSLFQYPVYEPPTQTTHWSWTIQKRRGSIQPDHFYNTYLRPLADPFCFSDRKTAFYWGYLSHLLTDIIWVDNVVIPVRNKVEADQLLYPEQAKELGLRGSAEWKEVDALFLDQHPNYAPLQIIRQMQPVTNDLLSYFDDTAMEEKRLECLRFYDSLRPSFTDPLRYTKPEDVAAVVEETAAAFLDLLEDRLFQHDHRTIRDITDFIFINDRPEPSDIIFVPGGSRHQPSVMAALLYQDGYAPYILPSGKYSLALGRFAHEKVTKDIYRGDFETEFEYCRHILRTQGVPEEAILKEDQAMHTMQNAEFSAAVVKASGITVKRAILCCKAYHARRALMSYAAHFPDVRFYVVPLDTDNITAHNWYRSESNYQKVLSELKKCGTYFLK